MCNKNSSPPSDSQPKHPMTSTKEPTDSLITTTRRRIPRKRKFRSLSLQLSANPSHHHQQNQSKRMKHQNEQQQQLNLFPLHPENMVEDKDDNMQDENEVALLFSSDGGATLNGLLEGDYSTTTTTTATTRTTTTSEEDSFSPPSMTCHMSDGDNGSWLVRKAMRRREKERDESEERWVCYSEVTSYCNSTAFAGGAARAMDREPLLWFDEERGKGSGNTTAFRVLSLKLDYEGILNAWSDKGSFYVPPETPQTVPDLHNNAANVLWDGRWGNGAAGNLWKVPDNDGTNNMKIKVKEEMGDKLGQREASVLRYKEKRRSRLFSKRIRYEVRKLNAEKRPRMKGRFVKRD